MLVRGSEHSEKKDHLPPEGRASLQGLVCLRQDLKEVLKKLPHNCRMTPHPVPQPPRLCFSLLAQSVSSELTVGGMAFVTLPSPTILSIWLLVAVSE